MDKSVRHIISAWSDVLQREGAFFQHHVFQRDADQTDLIGPGGNALKSRHDAALSLYQRTRSLRPRECGFVAIHERLQLHLSAAQQARLLAAGFDTQLLDHQLS